MRVAGWQSRLIETFESAHGRRFRWGRHDCCQFAARCIKAVTGKETRLIFPPYRTRAEAELIVESCGGYAAMLAQALGEPMNPFNPSMIGEGDVVLLDFGRGPQPAVCMGVLSYAPGSGKLEFRETLTASAAWLL